MLEGILLLDCCYISSSILLVFINNLVGTKSLWQVYLSPVYENHIQEQEQFELVQSVSKLVKAEPTFIRGLGKHSC